MELTDMATKRRSHALLMAAKTRQFELPPPAKTGRHRTLDPVEKIHVSIPISLKAWFLDYSDDMGIEQTTIIRTLLKMLRNGMVELVPEQELETPGGSQ